MHTPSAMRTDARYQRLALTAILLAHVLLSIYTSLAVPLWESYDEPGHIAYAQYIGQNGALPPLGQKLSAYNESHQPPLYYLLPALPFLAIDTSDNLQPRYTASGRTWVVREPDAERFPWKGTALAIRLARLLSILPGSLAVALTWLAARHLFPQRPVVALAAALAHALWPLHILVNGVVSNDTAIGLMGSATLWQLSKFVTDPGKTRRYALLALTGALSIFVKDNGLALFGLAIMALVLVGLRRIAARQWRVVGQLAVAVCVATAVLALGVSLSGGRVEAQFGRAAGLLRRWAGSAPSISLQEPAAAGAQSIRTPASVLGGVNWHDALTSAVGRYSWGTLRPPPAWDTLSAVMLAAIFLSSMLGLALGPDRRGLFVCFAVIAAVGAAPVVRGAPEWVGGRFFLPAVGAFCILGAEAMCRWRSTALGKVGSAALVGGLGLYSILAPPVVLAPAYERPKLLDPASLPTGMDVESDLVFGNAVRLLGYSLPSPKTRVGENATVTLFWRVLSPIPRDHGVRLELFAEDGTSLEASWQQTPGNNNYPTSDWEAGATFADTISIPVKDHPALPSLSRFKITWFDQQLNTTLPAACGGQAIGCEPRISAGAIARPLLSGFGDLLKPPPPAIVTFGDTIACLAFPARSRAKPGDQLELRAEWLALRKPEGSYVAFVHIIDADGRVIAQQDDRPRRGNYPTTSWVAPERIEDVIRVAIPQTVPAGTYGVLLGWYEAPTGIRLKTTSGQVPIAHDVATVGILEVTP